MFAHPKQLVNELQQRSEIIVICAMFTIEQKITTQMLREIKEQNILRKKISSNLQKKNYNHDQSCKTGDTFCACENCSLHPHLHVCNASDRSFGSSGKIRKFIFKSPNDCVSFCTYFHSTNVVTCFYIFIFCIFRCMCGLPY